MMAALKYTSRVQLPLFHNPRCVGTLMFICLFLDSANRRVTRQMLKSKSGEFDVSNIHMLDLSSHGAVLFFANAQLFLMRTLNIVFSP